MRSIDQSQEVLPGENPEQYDEEFEQNQVVLKLARNGISARLNMVDTDKVDFHENSQLEGTIKRQLVDSLKKEGHRSSDIQWAIGSLGKTNLPPADITEQIRYTKRDIEELYNNNTMPYVDSNDIIKADPNIYSGNFSYSDKKRHGQVLGQEQKIEALKGYIKEISVARELQGLTIHGKLEKRWSVQKWLAGKCDVFDQKNRLNSYAAAKLGK